MIDIFFFVDVECGIYKDRYGPYLDLSDAIIIMTDYAELWWKLKFPRAPRNHPMVLKTTEMACSPQGFEYIAERCKETRYNDDDLHD
jgi:hypothetical protein